MNRRTRRITIASAAAFAALILCFQAGTVRTDVDEIRLIDCGDECYLRVGESWKPTAKAVGATSESELVWTSRTPAVLEVSKTGTMKGLKAGTGYAVVRSSKNPRLKKAIIVHVTTAKYIAHAGLSTKAPADTKKAFELAGRAHFWGAEADIRITKTDKRGNFEIVVCHDASLKKACGVNKRVKNLTWPQLKKLKVTGGTNASHYEQGLCTLEQFLDICERYGMVPYLDIKTDFGDAEAKKIADTLHERGFLEKTRFVGYKHSSMTAIKDYSTEQYGASPRMILNCNMQGSKQDGRTTEQQIQFAASNGFQGISLIYKQVTEKRMQLLETEGLEINLWTFSASSKSKMKMLLMRYPSIDTVMVNGMVE